MSRPSERAQLSVTEAELRVLTDELDEAHRGSLPAMRAELAKLAGPSRRGMLLGGLAAGGLVGLAAGCSGDANNAAAAPTVSPGSPGTASYTGENRVVALAAALENLAVLAYDGVARRAAAGTYGAVPPAVSRFVSTVRAQHAEHAAAWNSVLTAAKLPPVTGAPLKITPSVTNALNSTKSLTDVASFALSLEDSAAQTYVKVTGTASNPRAISTAATIAPVEAMHAAVLNLLLGRPPVPDTFIPTRLSVNPNELTS